MKRRDFLKVSAPFAAVPFFSGRLFAASMPVSLLDAALMNAMPPQDDRVLVIVQINGGNDGLNTVLPLDQYSRLAVARPNILIPDTAALRLGNTQTGLHPSMTGMRDLFNQSRLSIIQSVSYANPNFSHFRATDIWMSGSNATSVVNSGWIGRFLQFTYPGFPDQYPNPTMPDPLSIAIGSSLDLLLQGYSISTGQTVPTNFSGSLTSLLPYRNSTVPNTNAGIEVAFLRNQQQYTNQYGTNIVNAWNAGTNSITYPTPPQGVGNNLSQQLRIVARLIKGGLKTRVYWVRTGGFDTHANQVDNANKTLGAHANLLRELSDAISAFQNDLQGLGLADRVMGMTFSEFGRRIKSNASSGTDHGTAYPMFLFGTKLRTGIVGTNPVIPANAGVNDNVPMQYDFHSVYLSVLKEWFCLTDADANAVLGFGGAPLSTINADCSALPVIMTFFSAEKANKQDVHVTWGTAGEDNARDFEVQRSTDGVRFTTIGTVAAKGHAHEPERYEYLDEAVPLQKGNVFYYRLKTRDNDGAFMLSEIRSVTFEAADGAFAATVSPNPSTDGRVQLSLSGHLEEDTMTEIAVTDLYGRMLYQQEQVFPTGALIPLDLGGDGGAAAAGIYFVTVRHGARKAVQKVVVR
jgi:uncharacterized protein (DUF1501 family)